MYNKTGGNEQKLRLSSNNGFLVKTTRNTKKKHMEIS